MTPTVVLSILAGAAGVALLIVAAYDVHTTLGIAVCGAALVFIGYALGGE